MCAQAKDPKTIINGYTPTDDGEESLPAIIPVKVKGEVLWAYLDTGSGRNFISSEAIKRAILQPIRYEVRQIFTVNGTKQQSLPVYDLHIESLNGDQMVNVEVTGSKLPNFTTIKRPDVSKLKQKYDHVKNKMFYKTLGNEYTIDMIIGDKLYCKELFKGGDNEGTKFCWVIHGGQFPGEGCLLTKELPDHEQLYSLDVLGLEDKKENDQQEVYAEFSESVTKDGDGRYQVGIP